MAGIYTSTRDDQITCSFSQAILQGTSSQGGLTVPKCLALSQFNIEDLLDYKYRQIAYKILRIFTDDFEDTALYSAVCAAYNSSFDIAEVVNCSEVGNTTLLELTHGPTSAFKDIALQILPQFINQSKATQHINNKTLILVATSGDTGKAALEGFKNQRNIDVICLYPNNLVSKIQEKQMLTTRANNTFIYPVNGTFDDCQKMVKDVFNDTNFISQLQNKKIDCTSANSINIGRLVPQIVYYFSSYMNLVERGIIKLHQQVNFVVPTGNFGNILAGYYAKVLGLPIHKLICASNANNVLTEFIQTGIYDKRREFHKTISPSMDILVSSNVERYLYECCNHDTNRVSSLMSDLTTKGMYTLDKNELIELQKHFVSYSCDDKSTKHTIKKVFDETHRVIDSHTAVGYHCYEQYLTQTNDETYTIVLSTASCYKFPLDVYSAISNEHATDELDAIYKIEQLSSEKIPTNILDADRLPFTKPNPIQSDELKKIILERIK